MQLKEELKKLKGQLEKQFEEVVIIAFEWFRKNKPELLNERKRRE